MYLIQSGPVVYAHKDGTRDGRPFTLVEALRETYGVGQTRILRTDGTVVVRDAGSATAVEYAPTGRKITRRARRRGRHWSDTPAARRARETAANEYAAASRAAALRLAARPAL